MMSLALQGHEACETTIRRCRCSMLVASTSALSACMVPDKNDVIAPAEKSERNSVRNAEYHPRNDMEIHGNI